MNRRNDQYYIQLVLNGNKSAFANIVEIHKDNVFTLAVKICGNREDAEEVAQDSFVKAYRNLGSFKQNSKFATWLYKIVYNTAISCIRKRKKQVLQLDNFPADYSDFSRDNSFEEDADTEYKKALLAFALQKININDRAIISMHYLQEMSIDEISKATGIKGSNLKVKLFRSRKKLQEILINSEIKERVQYDRV